MIGFKSNIQTDTLENTNFRKVVYTTRNFQMVLMCIKAGEDIGEEIHFHNDQFFRFESGKGKCTIAGIEYEIKSGDVIIVPAGTKHNIVNTDSTLPLKLYTIYSPPHHLDGTIEATKVEAELSKEKFDGITSEKRTIL